MYHKIIKKITPNGLERSVEGKLFNINLLVVGIFNTQTVHWDYYYLSSLDSNNNNPSHITNDCTKYPSNLGTFSIQNIIQYCIKTQTAEESIKWCEDFKMKWEMCTNDALYLLADP